MLDRLPRRALVATLVATLVAALPLALVGCGDATPRLIAEDATAAWSVTLPDDWAPTQVFEVGEVLVVVYSWSEDEGVRVLGLDEDGGELWTEGDHLSGTTAAAVDDEKVRICSQYGTDLIVAESGEQQDSPDDATCPEPAESEIADRYAVSGDTLTVYDEDDEPLFEVPLEDSGPSVWPIDGAVVTYAPDGGTLRLYR